MKFSKDNLKKIFFPYFPDDNKIRKYWWHKLIKLAAMIVSVSSLYTILWLITLFYFLPRSWMDSPLYPPIYHLSYMVAYLPMNFTSLLSSFPIYGTVFHALLPVPVIGPLALIFILIAILYIAPSLLYRLAIYISQKFYMKRVKIIFFAVLLALGLFVFVTGKYQQLINKGSMIADEQCLKVNPLIIARKNSYINSMKILLASGSADEYWAETNKYLDYSKKYIDAQKAWLTAQKSYMDSQDFNTYNPSYIKKAAQAQYNSREAEMKATSAIVELFETYKDIDAEKQKALLDTINDDTKKSNDEYNEFNRIYKTAQEDFDFRDNFTSVPQSKCPPENFNIPGVNDSLNPKSMPVNNGYPIS